MLNTITIKIQIQLKYTNKKTSRAKFCTTSIADQLCYMWIKIHVTYKYMSNTNTTKIHEYKYIIDNFVEAAWLTSCVLHVKYKYN